MGTEAALELGRSEASAQGMRPILVAQSPEEADIQAFIDSMYVWPTE